MASVRLYIDEDAMARALVQGLRARDTNVLTAFEANMTGRNDADQLAFSTEQNRVIYTFNVGDFCRLHAEYMARGDQHTGIIVVPRQRYSIGEQMRALLGLINARTAEEMTNKLTFL